MKAEKQSKARIVMTVLTAAAVCLIFYNSSLSALESTQQSSPLTEWINGILAALPIPFSVTEDFVRKLAHFTEYTILGSLLSVTVYLYCRHRRRMLLIALPIGAAVAACDETIQLFSEGRSSEIRDVMIDCCGVLFAACVVRLILWIKEKRRSRRTD